MSALDRLGTFAEDQWGLFTRNQAAQVDIDPATITRLTAHGSIERVAHGVYRLAGAPIPDHLALRAAWLQLAPEVPAWNRTPEQGVVSHRSAAALLGLGDLAADRHDFILAKRRQTRREDVRLHTGALRPGDWSHIRSLPVTRPARTVAALLTDGEEPAAVARVIADALRSGSEAAQAFAEALEPFALKSGFRRGDGAALLRWLLDSIGETPAGYLR